ncbi:Hypothetical protein J6898_03047 [Nakaseomyces glabratus]
MDTEMDMGIELPAYSVHSVHSVHSVDSADSADILECAEELPGYSPAVEKFVRAKFKLEWESPTQVSRDPCWYDVVLHINSTQLNLYLPRCPKSRPASKSLSYVSAKPSVSGVRRLSERFTRFKKTYLPAFEPLDFHPTPAGFTNSYQNIPQDALGARKKRSNQYDFIYDTNYEEYCSETCDSMDVSTGFVPFKSYSLQGAKVGMPTSESRKKVYIDEENVYKDAYLVCLRLRMEDQQFLVQFEHIDDMIMWSMYLSMGINVSKDLYDREYPNYRIVPRRRRRRHSGHSRRRFSSRRRHSSGRTPVRNTEGPSSSTRRRANSFLKHFTGAKSASEPLQIDFKNPFTSEQQPDAALVKQKSHHEPPERTPASDQSRSESSAHGDITPNNSISRSTTTSLHDNESDVMDGLNNLTRSPSECLSLYETLTANSSFCEYDLDKPHAKLARINYNFDYWSPLQFGSSLSSTSSLGLSNSMDCSFDSNESTYPDGMIPELIELEEEIEEDDEDDIDIEDYGLEEFEIFEEGEELETDDMNDCDTKWNPVKKEQTRKRYIRHSLRCIRPLAPDAKWEGETIYVKAGLRNKMYNPSLLKDIKPYLMETKIVGAMST